MTDAPTGPPPGWYDDPSGRPGTRWWDGNQWTNRTGTSPFSSVQHHAATRSHRFAVWALPVVACCAVLNALNAIHYSWVFHEEFHYINRASHITNGKLPTPPVLPAGYQDVNFLLGVSLVVAAVLLLQWQFRSAKRARLLGFPARRTPGLGVGGWFIPVVNLWFPYQALRDCLSPDDAERPRVLRFWLSLLSADILTVAAELSGPSSHSVAYLLLFLAAVTWCVAVALGERLIRAIEASHVGRLRSAIG